MYRETVDLNSVTSALRAVAGGAVPQYDSGGSLTQLGGTVVFKCGDEVTTPAVHRPDTTTGGHLPPHDLARALHALNMHREWWGAVSAPRLGNRLNDSAWEL